MKLFFKIIASAITGLVFLAGCGKENYDIGSLNAPSNVAVSAIPQGIDATHPNGDGSGKVDIVVSGSGILGTSMDFGAGANPDFKSYPSGKTTASYETDGTKTYTITAITYGAGGKQTSVTKDVTVLFVFVPDADLVTNLTGTGTKTWRVDSSTAGHFGVGPWGPTNVTPAWYSAPPGDKRDKNCFYTARFTFTKTGSTYSLTSTTPFGALTKTGVNSGGLPGIPTSGEEDCYSYAGGTSAFTWKPPTSGVASDKTSGHAIVLSGVSTFIGYGAVQKEYEILEHSATSIYLRVRGTETGNAWYIRLVPA